jgi:hypothetical protein
MYQRLEPYQPSLSTNDPLQAGPNLHRIGQQGKTLERYLCALPKAKVLLRRGDPLSKVFNNRAQMRHKVGETKGNTPKIALFELPKSQTTVLRVETL